MTRDLPQGAGPLGVETSRLVRATKISDRHSAALVELRRVGGAVLTVGDARHGKNVTTLFRRYTVLEFILVYSSNDFQLTSQAARGCVVTGRGRLAGRACGPYAQAPRGPISPEARAPQTVNKFTT